MSARAIGRAALLLAPALLAGAAAAQEPGSARTRDYVQAAGNSDAFELLEATTALAESKDAQVRAFAQRMLEDHHRLAAALREATARAGLKPPPAGLGSGQAPFLAALQSLRGAAFDRAYWQQQALAHRAALVETQGYAANGDTPAIRQAAAAAAPVIAGHLAMAERMAAGSGGS